MCKVTMLSRLNLVMRLLLMTVSIGAMHLRAAQIDVALTNIAGVSGYIDHPIISVNTGDTVRWSLRAGPPNGVTSYGEGWGSGVLTNVGDSFLHTFTNEGAHAYHLNNLNHDAVVFVNGIGSQPTHIVVNDPIEGLLLPSAVWGVQAVASVSVGETNVAKVQFYWGTNIVAAITTPPYTFTSYAPTDQVVTLMAELVRVDGSTARSKPVHFAIGGPAMVYSPQLLPSGEFLLFWRTTATDIDAYVEHKDRVTDAHWTVLKAALGFGVRYGVAVDTNSVVNLEGFYRSAWGELPPP